MLVGQLIFDGFSMGLVFVILACGLVLITSVNRILFMAYGIFYTIGAYTTWASIQHLKVPYVVALLVGLIVSGILGIICYIVVLHRLQRLEGGFLATLIASMGLLMLLNQGSIAVFGTEIRSIPSIFPGMLNLGGITISYAKVGLIILSIVVTILLFLMYEKTSIGRSMRAVSFMPEGAALQGINSTRVYIATIGVGTALAGFAGGAIAPVYSISPDMGANVVWTVMLMMMLGGMDSLLGAVVGGVVIGQILSFGQYFIGGAVQIIVLAVVGIVLYFKPTGLLGRGIDIGV
ncbi:MAG: branched-chain amino acid ABC transporter permease [Thermoleophilia bacterium]|nr:branched-chain amino acid ABC transporter permease [Thermoleophilia bacterium]